MTCGCRWAGDFRTDALGRLVCAHGTPLGRRTVADVEREASSEARTGPRAPDRRTHADRYQSATEDGKPPRCVCGCGRRTRLVTGRAGRYTRYATAACRQSAMVRMGRARYEGEAA